MEFPLAAVCSSSDRQMPLAALAPMKRGVCGQGMPPGQLFTGVEDGGRCDCVCRDDHLGDGSAAAPPIQSARRNFAPE